jgi:hypothetical protein
MGRLDPKNAQIDVVERRREHGRVTGRMQAPTSVRVDSTVQISNDFSPPFFWNVGVCDIHGNHKTSKEETGTAVSAAPVAVSKLELLIEAKAVAS